MVQQGLQASPKKSKFDDPHYPAYQKLRKEKDYDKLTDSIVDRVLIRLDSIAQDSRRESAEIMTGLATEVGVGLAQGLHERQRSPRDNSDEDGEKAREIVQLLGRLGKRGSCDEARACPDNSMALDDSQTHSSHHMGGLGQVRL